MNWKSSIAKINIENGLTRGKHSVSTQIVGSPAAWWSRVRKAPLCHFPPVKLPVVKKSCSAYENVDYNRTGSRSILSCKRTAIMALGRTFIIKNEKSTFVSHAASEMVHIIFKCINQSPRYSVTIKKYFHCYYTRITSQRGSYQKENSCINEYRMGTYILPWEKNI